MELPYEIETAIGRIAEKIAAREHLADCKWRKKKRAYSRILKRTGDTAAVREVVKGVANAS